MVDKSELEAIAEEMVRNGESPSIRTVRSRLPGGGSHRVIGLMLADWRTNRKSPPQDVFPASLRNKLEAVASEIWQYALAVGESDRKRLASRVDALERSFVEAVARADAFAERLANSGTDPDGAPEAPASKLSRAEALSLWADVMREIDGLLAGGNWLAPEEIIHRLDPATLRKVAHELTGAAKEARLAHKMRERKLKGVPWFVEVDRRFALLGEFPDLAPKETAPRAGRPAGGTDAATSNGRATETREGKGGDGSGAKPRRRQGTRKGNRGEDRPA